MESDMPTWKSILVIICSILFISLLLKGCSAMNGDSSSSSGTSKSSTSRTYDNYHKCEYPGCDNYASKTKYCSVHNQTKCSKRGCSNKEAYQGAGICKEHLYQSIQNY